MARSSEQSEHNSGAPAADELEISLFGPGFGECIVVHYGDGKWITVDSCLESDRETPSALAYFENLGLDPAECVTHNLITHPDGDHIGGISKLYLSCTAARLVCSTVLAHKDMVRYATYFAQTDPTPLTRTSRELYDVLKQSVERPPNSPLYVKQDTVIIGQPNIRITALAPSDQKILKFLGRVSRMIPEVKSIRRAPGKLLPNDVSAALLIEFNGVSAVFGADLEETPGDGWTTVLGSSVCFAGAASPSVFKVAHHGSQNADCPALWEKMDKPIAVLAPFNLGRHKIPTPNDVTRILDYTDKAFSTSSFKTQKVKRLSRVDKLLVQHGIRRQDLFPKNGQIRVRIDQKNTPTVELFESAVHLSQVH